MKKQLVIIGIVAILFTVGLSGCTTQNNNENQDNNILSTEKSKFVGTWKHTNNESTLYIHSDGTWTSDSTVTNLSSGTWNVTEGKFIFTYGKTGRTVAYMYTFSNNDETLKIYDDFVTLTSSILYKQ